MQCTAPGERPCGVCPQCRKVLDGAHPDICIVDDPEKKTIPVKLVRDACTDLYIRPNEGQRKIYLFPRAQDLNQQHLITEKKISGVPVTDGSQNLIGFLSDGDILRFLADVEPLFINASALQELPNFEERTKELMAMQVRDIAKKQVISVGAEMELGEVCQILTENHIKKAPVLENGKMIGIINMSNITKYVLRKMM